MNEKSEFDQEAYDRAMEDAYPHTADAQFEQVIAAWNAFIAALGIHRLANWLARAIRERRGR